MKKIICIVLFFISAGNCFGQQMTFQKTYGGTDDDRSYAVQQTIDGGYVIAGFTAYDFGAGGADFYLIKTDANGDTSWTRTFGGTNSDAGSFVQQTTDGGYIIVGNTYSFSAGVTDVYLIKTDTNGDTLWTKTFGGTSHDFGYFVQQTTDGGYIITGMTGSFGPGNNDVYLIKTDANGDSLWTKTFGGINDDGGSTLQQTADGGYVIAGITGSFGAGNYDVYVIKTDSSGNLVWTKTFGGTDSDGGGNIQQTSDGGFIIVGTTHSFGAGDDDIYLIKTDANGDSLWTKTFGGINDDDGSSVKQTTDGGYVIAGQTNSFGAGNEDVYLIKTNASGDSLWTKTIGETDDDDGFFIQQVADGGYVIAGYTNNQGTGHSDFLLIKTDSLGNSGCNEESTATIITSPATQVTNPATIVTSPPTIVTTPVAIVRNGGIVTTLCITSIPSAIPNPLSAITISPNPTSNNFTITFPNTINKGVIEIYNVMGEKIFKEDILNVSQKEISLDNINAGIYFVKVRDGEKEYCEKLVIE